MPAPFVDHFVTHVIFLREEVIEKRSQAVRAFLQGWFNTIAFMKANKAKTACLAPCFDSACPGHAVLVLCSRWAWPALCSRWLCLLCSRCPCGA